MCYSHVSHVTDDRELQLRSSARKSWMRQLSERYSGMIDVVEEEECLSAADNGSSE